MHSTNSQAAYSPINTEPELFQMDVWMKGDSDLSFSTGGSQIFPNGQGGHNLFCLEQK